MDAQNVAQAGAIDSLFRDRVQQLEVCAKLSQLADALVHAMTFPKEGGEVSALRQLGVSVTNANARADGAEIECLGQRFRFVRRFVMLEKSAVIGLTLRVIRFDDSPLSERLLAKLYIRADEKVLVSNLDRTFARDLGTGDDMDVTGAALLTMLADTAIVELTKVSY